MRTKTDKAEYWVFASYGFIRSYRRPLTGDTSETIGSVSSRCQDGYQIACQTIRSYITAHGETVNPA